MDHVYKSVELTGSSEKGLDQAVETAIKKASETIRDMRWFEVTGIRGHIEENKIGHWQVTVKVGFTINSDS